MKVVVHGTFTVSQKATGVTLARGYVELENEIGHTCVPIRLFSTYRNDELGVPFLSVDQQATYNGGKSIFSPWVDVETANAIKQVIPAGKLFDLTDEAGEGVELTLELDEEVGLKEVARRVRNMISGAAKEKMLELSKKFADKAAELKAKKEEKSTALTKEELRQRMKAAG